MRWMLFVLALVACKDKAKDPDPKPSPPRIDAAAAIVDDKVVLPDAPEAVTIDVTSAAAVVIRANGDLSVAPLGPEQRGQFDPGSVRGDAVQLADLPAKLKTIFDALPDPFEGKSAKEIALEHARRGGVLASFDPCSPYGVLTSRTFDALVPEGPVPAGLRAVPAAGCFRDVPLVLAHPDAAAARVIEVLSAVPRAQLGATADGGKTVRALALAFSFQAGNQPAATREEIALAIDHGGDPLLVKKTLLGTKAPARARIGADVTAGELVAALGQAAAYTQAIGLGDPVDYLAPASDVPLVQLEHLAILNLDETIARNLVHAQSAELRACYEQALAAKPGLDVSVTARFMITVEGKAAMVKTVEDEDVPEALASCVVDVLEAIQFPEPPKRMAANVTDLTLRFRPRGG